ncbi:MAG: hypothetical protein AMXMBFR4_23650 [Candidatus Hydrogenedentota bacterium]
MTHPHQPPAPDPSSDAPTVPPSSDFSSHSRAPTFITARADLVESFRQASIGTMLDGRYRILDVKGGPGLSGMGLVYIVEGNERRYAAKTFQHQFARNLPLVERFLREARTWILTGFHRNIVHAYFIDIIDATPFLFMEYIEPDDRDRVSLADWLRQGSIRLTTAVDWALQCCDGMIHARASVPGLVHRDLKPENLLITRDGTLKITDFGLVRSHISEEIAPTTLPVGDGPSDLTQAGATFGTPAYMAPEQFDEAGQVGEAADIYAFGCCFYEAISGARLFTIRSDTPIEHLLVMRRMHQTEPPVPLRKRVPECPQELDRIIMRCLEKDPDDRWYSFQELRDELARVGERILNITPAMFVPGEPTARQVAEQMQSLTLLDGYTRAIRLPGLRESHDTSPYAFHLALASYFRTMEETEEEGRQLEKAMNVRSIGQGYEAARRLAELYVESNKLERAERLLDAFLGENPGALDSCLEPLVALRIARGQHGEAEALLAPLKSTMRTQRLLARVFEAAGRRAELRANLETRLQTLLAGIKEKIDGIDAGDRVGWEQDGDVEILRAILRELEPDCDTSVLDRVEHAVWPDLDVYPDFSADMAWLSDTLGGLSDADEECGGRYAELARILGFPHRLPRHLARDEMWFWSKRDDADPPGQVR